MTRISNFKNPAFAGAILMILAGALFAVVNTLVQLGAMHFGLASTKLAFWQYLIAFVTAAPIIFLFRKESLRTAAFPQHVLRVLLAAGGVQLWVLGLAHVPIWQAIALIMLSPFFVTLGARMILKEDASPRRWTAVLIGFCGGMIILAPWSEAFTISALLPVGAAALWAASSLLTKRMTHTESPESLTLYLLLLLTPINALIALPQGLTPETGTPGLLLLAAGVLTALAQFALVKAYSIADAAYLQPFDHVKLPFNVLLGLLVFGFVPPGTLWLGAMLIIGASFLLLLQETRAECTP